MRKRSAVAGIALVPLVLAACPDSGSVTPPAGVLSGCLEPGQTSLPMTIRSTGSTSFNPIAGTLTEKGTTQVDWQPTASTGTTVDGAVATGTLTPTAASTPTATVRSLSATGVYNAGSLTGIRITVAGTLNGPPPPCTGSGSWVVNQSLRGTWSIP